jgi:uncharacterized protein (DUF1697 family)
MREAVHGLNNPTSLLLSRVDVRRFLAHRHRRVRGPGARVSLASDGRCRRSAAARPWDDRTQVDAVNVYVALLRGINVGGSNLIRMAALKACFEAEGFREVATYIQSGNVLFTASRANQRTLTDRIEKALSKSFAYQSRVVIRSFEQMKATIENAPKGFGRQPTAYRYDVIFLRDPLTPDEAMKSVITKPGVDRVFAGDGVLYFSRLISRAAQSRLSRVVGTPAYQNMTIRNWNTTAKLLGLMNRIQSG